MTDVALVLMPFAAVERPSLALGLLKATLDQAGIRTETCHAPLLFAGEIGLPLYHALSNGPAPHLLGEWVFSEAAFPDFQPDHAAYFHLVRRSLFSLQSMSGILNVGAALWDARRRAAPFIDRLARRILRSRPRIIGCSSTFQQHCASLALLRRIRELAPKTVTLLGGHNTEGEMGEVIRRLCPWIDCIVSGEAEKRLPSLCAELLQSTVIHPLIPRRIACEPPDLGGAPAPDYDEYFDLLARCDFARAIHPGLPMEASRGCWWGARKQCRFCGLNGPNLTSRLKPSAQVQQQMASLARRHHLHRFGMVDNILHPSHLRTLIPSLARQKRKYEIFFETSAVLAASHLRSLSAAGVRWLQPGIESLDDDLLRLMGKGTNALRNLQLLKSAREQGIHLTWLLLYGIPDESDRSYCRMAEWLTWISHLQPPNAMSPIQFAHFSPYHAHPAAYGLKLAPARTYRFIFPFRPAELRRLAAYFEDRGRAGEDRLVGAEGRRHPGLRAVFREVLLWQRAWRPHLFPEKGRAAGPVLTWKDDGRTLTLHDTRSCALEKRVSFRGLPRHIHRLCGEGPTHNELLKSLGVSKRDLDEWLGAFRQRRLLLNIRGRLLALAVRSPLRAYPHWMRFPCGCIERRLLDA